MAYKLRNHSELVSHTLAITILATLCANDRSLCRAAACMIMQSAAFSTLRALAAEEMNLKFRLLVDLRQRCAKSSLG
jgi:hypothetical protein